MTELPAITLDQLGDSMRAQADALSKTKDFLEEAGKLMLQFIRERFDREMGPGGTPWKSTAKETKLGGRFAASYTRGGSLSSGSKRLQDTGELLNSYSVRISDNSVTVAPEGARNVMIAQAAAEEWNNMISGWDEESIRRVNAEFEKFLEKAAGL